MVLLFKRLTGWIDGLFLLSTVYFQNFFVFNTEPLLTFENHSNSSGKGSNLNENHKVGKLYPYRVKTSYNSILVFGNSFQ